MALLLQFGQFDEESIGNQSCNFAEFRKVKVQE